MSYHPMQTWPCRLYREFERKLTCTLRAIWPLSNTATYTHKGIGKGIMITESVSYITLQTSNEEDNNDYFHPGSIFTEGKLTLSPLV